MARRPMKERPDLPENQERFSLTQAAAAVGVHKITLYNWERFHKLPQLARPLRLKRNRERIYTRGQVQEIWRWMNETVEDSAA